MVFKTTDSLVEQRLEGAHIGWKFSSESGRLVGVAE